MRCSSRYLRGALQRGLQMVREEHEELSRVVLLRGGEGERQRLAGLGGRGVRRVEKLFS